MPVRPSRYRTVMAAAWELLSLSPQTRNRPLHPSNRANYHPEQTCQSRLFIPPSGRRRKRIKTTFSKCIRFNYFNCRGLMCQTLSLCPLLCLSSEHFSDKPISSVYHPKGKENEDFVLNTVYQLLLMFFWSFLCLCFSSLLFLFFSISPFFLNCQLIDKSNKRLECQSAVLRTSGSVGNEFNVQILN